MMLEDFAMANRINRARAAHDMEEDPESSAASTPFAERMAASLQGAKMMSSPRVIDPKTQDISTSFDTTPLGMVVDSNVNIWMRVVQVLPSIEGCHVMLEFYFTRLHWYTKVLHRPTFQEHSDEFLAHLSLLRSAGTPQAGPSCDPTIPPLNMKVYAITLWLMVLCISFHLIEPQLCDRLGYTMSEAGIIAKRLYSAVQTCMYHQDFLGNHSLEHLQTIILMGIYQQNLDEADTHWGTLGAAIKIAQNLGLSRLGSENDGRHYSEHWKSVVKRETARRIWWFLVYDDWSHAAAHNGTYSVHPSQNYTGFPLNVNDDDIVDGSVSEGKPMSEYTEMTFFLCRLRFVTYYREIVDHMNNPVAGYDFVLDMDKKLSVSLKEFLGVFNAGNEDDDMDDPRPGKKRKLDSDRQRLSRKPSTLSNHGDRRHGESGRDMEVQDGRVNVKEVEKMLMLIMGETRRLRLHRPYLFRGYKEQKYAKSRDQCVESARAILNLLKSESEQSGILLKWWIVLFYGFAAAVVLFIDLCHHKSGNGPNLAHRRTELMEALQLFKTTEHVSAVSRNAIALLEGIITAEPETSGIHFGQRSVQGEDAEEREEGPFELIVKRIIVDSSKGMGAPSPSVSRGQASPQPATSPMNSAASWSPKAAGSHSHPHPPPRSHSHHVSPANAGGHSTLGNTARRTDYDVHSSHGHSNGSGHGHGLPPRYSSHPPHHTQPSPHPPGGYGTNTFPSAEAGHQSNWQFDNPFGQRWDLSLLGFPSAESQGVMDSSNGAQGNSAANGTAMQFPDMSDTSMAELSQILLGFGGGSGM